MTPISARFDELERRGEKALILFLTAGDPELAQLPDLLDALADGGADLIEIGIPFSDPIADGPMIQASSQRALDRGVTPAAVFDLLSHRPPPVPLVAMGYYNSMLKMGLGNAANALKQAHVSGSIISDLTPEESVDWCEASWQAGIDNIFLAAPTSTDARLDEVTRRASGFVYAVSRTGVTSADVAVGSEARALVDRLRAKTELPIGVGFGVSTPEHVRAVCEFADGAILGSRIVDLLAQEWRGGAGRAEVVARIREFKAATRPAR